MNTTNERSVVITGGSGFVGSNVCKLFVDSGFNVINIDRKKREMEGVTQYPFEVDSKQVKGILQIIKPDVVVHIAADNSVPKSMQNPKDTYTDNVYQTINLLNNCVDIGIKNFIFASSSSVYGTSVNEDGSFKEDDPLNPINPYGRSKKMCESIIKDYASAYNFNYGILRLFNVAGSNGGKLGYQKDPAVHILPILIQKIIKKEGFEIFGNSYQTPDGTCVRDYTHVSDVARAFLSTAYYMMDRKESIILNIGNHSPLSVKELIDAVEQQLDVSVTTTQKDTRSGDMPKTYADITHAIETIGWEPTKSINEIIQDEYRWQKLKVKVK